MKRIILILFFIFLFNLGNHAQIMVLLSKEQNQKIKDSYKNQSIRSYITVYGSPKNDSTIEVSSYQIYILDSLGNTIYRISYSDQKKLQDFEKYFYSKDQLLITSLWYRNSVLFDKSQYIYSSNGELKESLQLDKNDKVVSKSIYIRNKNNLIKSEFYDSKGRKSGIRIFSFDKNNYPKKEKMIDFLGNLSNEVN